MKNEDISEECEYLIGDDTCSAVEEAEVSSLRAEACQNEIKDRCCYKCSVREKCDIRCDLLEHGRQEKDEKQPVTSVSNADRSREATCGDCDFSEIKVPQRLQRRSGTVEKTRRMRDFRA